MLNELQRTCDEHIRHTNATKYRINLLNDRLRPAYFTPYRAASKASQFTAAKMNRMIRREHDRASITELAGIIAFATKKEGLVRFSVDYQELNTVSICDLNHLSPMTDCNRSLRVATVLSTLNATSRHRQIEIVECNRDKSGFTSHHGLCRSIRMPFGMKNAQADLQ